MIYPFQVGGSIYQLVYVLGVFVLSLAAFDQRTRHVCCMSYLFAVTGFDLDRCFLWLYGHRWNQS